MTRLPVPLPIPATHPAFAGHFPGRPLVPGAVLLAEVLEAALADPLIAAAIGVAPRLGIAKFVSPAEPGDPLACRFEFTATAVRFEVHSGERLVAMGHFERAAQASSITRDSTAA